MPTPRSIKRAAKEAAQDAGRSIEAQAAEARNKRADAFAGEYKSFVEELQKRHNCRLEFAVQIAGTQIPASQVISCPIVLHITANIE